jgi:glutathione S-transferase
MELLYSSTSPFCRKVLVVAHELGIADRIQLLPVHPREQVETVAQWNPLGKIPALSVESDMTIYDSTVICAWLDATLGESHLHPTGDRKWPVLKEIALADGILEAASSVRQERLRPLELRSLSAIATELRRVHRALDKLEADVETFEAPINMGQLSLACAVDWLSFRLPDQDWLTDRPRLSRAMDALLRRFSLVKTDPRL